MVSDGNSNDRLSIDEDNIIIFDEDNISGIHNHSPLIPDRKKMIQHHPHHKTSLTEEIIDDWKLDLNFHLYAHHELRAIYSRNLRSNIDNHHNALGGPEQSSSMMWVECVESQTPLDMVNFGHGIHDATGNCVWSGAFLFIEALHLLEDYFRGRSVIELGSGTGVGGISLLCSSPLYHASHVTLTDADPNALEVCRRNCQHNHLSESSYSVHELIWGTPVPEAIWTARGRYKPDDYFDTVFATDVLYDIGSLPALFQTAVECLGPSGGSFLLSHVPRACYSSLHPPVGNLEESIIEQARLYGFGLEKILRPLHLHHPEGEMARPKEALNYAVSLEELDKMCAAILIFHRKR